MWGQQVSALFSGLHNGMFLSGERCECRVGVVCSECVGMRVEERLFVFENSFAGLNPSGKQHWWTGITDAAGIVQVLRGRPWYWKECFNGWGN